MSSVALVLITRHAVSDPPGLTPSLGVIQCQTRRVGHLSGPNNQQRAALSTAFSPLVIAAIEDNAPSRFESGSRRPPLNVIPAEAGTQDTSKQDLTAAALELA